MQARRLALIAALAASPSLAAERTVSVSDFDRVRVEGSFTVEVRRGPATTARIVGTQAAIEGASVTVTGRQLIVRRNRQTWGGYPGQTAQAATVRLTVPRLQNVWVVGPAKVSVDRLQGLRAGASLEGAGTLEIATVTADRFELGTLGSGTLTVGGTVSQLTISARGAGTVDAGRLAAQDVKLTSDTAGAITVAAKRAADVSMTGSGTVTVLGKPACTVKNAGAGTVTCG